jgi:cytochrome c
MQTPKILLIACLAIALSSLMPGAARAQDDGEKVFKRFCSACHTTESGANKIGPSLAGVVGRKAASVPAFNYSEASRNSGVTWNAATLD